VSLAMNQKALLHWLPVRKAKAISTMLCLPWVWLIELGCRGRIIIF
jgi:hypothetical protein